MATPTSNSRQASSRRNSSNGTAVLDRPENHEHDDLLQDEIFRLVRASQEGRLDERAKAHEFEGNDRQLLEGVNSILDAVVAPLKVASDYADLFSRGIIPQKIDADYKGDVSIVKNNINACIDSFGSLAEVDVVLQKMANNDYTSLVEGEYEGIFARLAQALNIVHKRIAHITSTMKSLAKGNIDELPEYRKIVRRSEGDELVPAIIEMMENIKMLVDEVDVLTIASVEGKLSTRTDASKHPGDFRRVIEGVNKTVATLKGHLDAMPSPVMIIDREFNIQYMNTAGAKAGGKLPQDLVGTKCYNHFKTDECNTETCACSRAMRLDQSASSETVARPVSGLELEIAYSAVPIRDGNGRIVGALEIVSDQSDLKRAARLVKKVADYQLAETQKLGDNLVRLSQGDTSVKIDTGVGDVDTAELRKMFETLNHSVNDTAQVLLGLQNELGRLTIASREGRLSERGKPDQFKGAYAGIVAGVNEMLDAILLPIGEGNRVLELIRGGNLRESVEIDCKGDHEKMKNAINGVHGWLTDLIAYITRIANGDLAATVAKASDKDQIHEWLVLMKENIHALAKDTNMMAAAALDGRVGTRADAGKHAGEYRKIIEGVNQTLEAVAAPLKSTAENASSLASSSEELTAVSQQMAGNAEETAVQANVVSAASEQVSRNVASVATASEEMQASIREIAKNANDSARVAKNAVSVAQSTNETMKKLGTSSQEIGNVIKVITSIAQQTNLLALNATIEAARAGEAGKGFAVVANEVKELAKQTAKATEEISQKIEAIQGVTKGAVTAIEEIGTIINQINDISNSIASAVEEQTVTTNEIGRSVTEAAQGVSDIAKNISGVATAAKNTTQGANDTKTASLELSEMAARLQASVSKFTF